MTLCPLRLLLIEDSNDQAELCQVLCRGAGLDLEFMRHARHLAEATRYITEEKFDVTLLDLALPDAQGVATIQYLHDHKQINDRFGHDAGDLALKEVAALLRATCRDSDLVARLGGDEFVILAACEGDPGRRNLQKRLAQALLARPAAPGAAWPLTLSYGVSHFDPAAPAPLSAMLAEADRAIYRVKRRRGRGPAKRQL